MGALVSPLFKGTPLGGGDLSEALGGVAAGQGDLVHAPF